MSSKKKSTGTKSRRGGHQQGIPTAKPPPKAGKASARRAKGEREENALSNPPVGDPAPTKFGKFTIRRDPEPPSDSIKPLARFDRHYIPEDEKAKEARESMLSAYDLGFDRQAYAEALLNQEIRHQWNELLRTMFGDMGKDSFLLRLAAEAHAGDKDALRDWQELAMSAVQHLRQDGILLKMHNALEKVAHILKAKTVDDRTRFLASLFALKCKEKFGQFPTKAAVRVFLDGNQIRRPADNNQSRLWKGPILGRLKERRAGRPGKRNPRNT